MYFYKGLKYKKLNMRKVRDCEGYYMKNNNNKWVFVKI